MWLIMVFFMKMWLNNVISLMKKRRMNYEQKKIIS